MERMYAICLWGICVPHDEVLNGSLDRNKLEAAGYRFLNPVSGFLTFYESGDTINAAKPFWFLPTSPTGFFEPYKDGIADVITSVTAVYPEVFYNLNVAERLCKVNIVHLKEGSG